MKSAWMPLVVLGIVIIGAIVYSIKKRMSTKQTQVDRSVISQGDLDEMISDWVGRKVREGFEGREEIINGVTEIIEDEYEVDDIREQVARETERQLNDHYERQRTWPEVTDCDKLDAAFDALEDKGIVARQNFSCCQNCGQAEIVDEIKAFSQKMTPIGYVFYHVQDTESACENGNLYLAYGCVSEAIGDHVKIGEMVRDVLTKHNLNVNWDGTLEKRICITELDWKKRRKEK